MLPQVTGHRIRTWGEESARREDEPLPSELTSRGGCEDAQSLARSGSSETALSSAMSVQTEADDTSNHVLEQWLAEVEHSDNTREKNERWNFDFSSEEPREGDIEWIRMKKPGP